MKIAILGGTGKEGQGLALRWAKGGAEVLIGSRERSKAERIASELGERFGQPPVHTCRGFDNREAAGNAAIVVSTLPHQGHQDVLENLRKELQDKLLMVATVIWPPVPWTGHRPPRRPQTVLGDGVRVVAAFQPFPPWHSKPSTKRWKKTFSFAGTMRQLARKPSTVCVRAACGASGRVR